MRKLLWAVLATLPVSAHVVSMSSGELTIDGARARFELRMPLYEVTHIARPEVTLLEHIRFDGAKLVRSECRADRARDAYLCFAEYEFSAPPDRLDVECTFPAITVPNHVHMLRAEVGGKRDQGIFDRSFTRATLRFRPPSAMETATAEASGGFFRALGGPAQILFLAALALAARSRGELLRLGAMFLAGQVAAVLIVPRTAWEPAPRFVEAAAALAIAYLAVEILLLPKAGARWLIAGVLGVFYGLFLHLFVKTAGYRPWFVLAGAAVGEAAVIAMLALLFARVTKWGLERPRVQVAAGILLAFGATWFIFRLGN